MSDATPLVAIEDVSTTTVSYVDKKTKEGERSVLLCNYTDVYYNRFIHSGIEFMSATATDREISRSSLQRGDVIITKDSEEQDDIGVPALVEDDIPNLVCGYHLAIIRPHEDVLNSRYLLYILMIDPVKEQFHRIARGLTRFGLRKEEMKAVQIPLPPLAEQRRIVVALEAQLAAAEQARRAALSQLNALEAMPAALLRKVFERDATLKAWRRVEISEVLALADNGVWGAADPNGISVLRSTNFRNDGTLDLSNLSIRAIDPRRQESKRLFPGDIILERSGGGPMQPVGRVCLFTGDSREHVFGNFCQRLRPDTTICNSDFLFYYLYGFHLNGGTEQFQNRTTGIRNLQYKRYLQQEIPLPPIGEQRRIVATLEREMAATERARTAAREGLALAEALPGAILRRAFAPGASA